MKWMCVCLLCVCVYEVDVCVVCVKWMCVCLLCV